MNYDGCKRKFNVKDFVKKYPPAEKNAIKAIRAQKEQGATEVVGGTKSVAAFFKKEKA